MFIQDEKKQCQQPQQFRQPQQKQQCNSKQIETSKFRVIFSFRDNKMYISQTNVKLDHNGNLVSKSVTSGQTFLFSQVVDNSAFKIREAVPEKFIQSLYSCRNKNHIIEWVHNYKYHVNKPNCIIDKKQKVVKSSRDIPPGEHLSIKKGPLYWIAHTIKSKTYQRPFRRTLLLHFMADYFKSMSTAFQDFGLINSNKNKIILARGKHITDTMPLKWFTWAFRVLSEGKYVSQQKKTQMMFVLSLYNISLKTLVTTELWAIIKWVNFCLEGCKTQSNKSIRNLTEQWVKRACFIKYIDGRHTKVMSIFDQCVVISTDKHGQQSIHFNNSENDIDHSEIIRGKQHNAFGKPDWFSFGL